jgi:anti-sigma B factor antagonist
MAPLLSINERRAGELVILDLTGRLVADEEDVLFVRRVDALLQAGVRHFLINFHDVTSLDSGGVGTLVAKYLSIRRHGGDMRLMHLTARTRRVLEITHLLTIFTVFESEADALRSFVPAGADLSSLFAAH